MPMAMPNSAATMPPMNSAMGKETPVGRPDIQREQRRAVCAHGHEARVAQRELAQITGGQVKAGGKDYVNANHHYYAGIVSRQHSGCGHILTQYEQRGYGDGIYYV